MACKYCINMDYRNHKKTQMEKVLDHLKFEGPINPKQALELYGCFRLAAIIHVLRKEGHNITTDETPFVGRDGNPGHYATYTLQEMVQEDQVHLDDFTPAAGILPANRIYHRTPEALTPGAAQGKLF